MKLPYKIKSIEDVAEGFRSLYVKTSDGDYVLEVDGVVPKEKLEEFRTNNIDLLKRLDGFKDLTPEKYQELLDTQKKREEKELIDKGELETVIQNRVKEMKSDYENKIGDLTNRYGTANKQLEVLMIDNEVRSAALKNGVRPEAVDDVLLRAKTVFSIKEGKVAALDEKGQLKYGKDGTTPLGIGDWSKGLKETAPHLFMNSQGGGAGNGSGRGPGPGANAGKSGVSRISAALESGDAYD